MSLRNGRSKPACFEGENRTPGIAVEGTGAPLGLAAMDLVVLLGVGAVELIFGHIFFQT